MPSDSELPERFSLAVSPCRAAGHRVLQRADHLAAACRDEALAIDGDYVEPHVIGAIQGGNGFFAEGLGEMISQQERLFSSQKKEGGSFSVIALGANQFRYGLTVPAVFEGQLGRHGRDVGIGSAWFCGVHFIGVGVVVGSAAAVPALGMRDVGDLHLKLLRGVYDAFAARSRRHKRSIVNGSELFKDAESSDYSWQTADRDFFETFRGTQAVCSQAERKKSGIVSYGADDT